MLTMIFHNFILAPNGVLKYFSRLLSLHISGKCNLTLTEELINVSSPLCFTIKAHTECAIFYDTWLLKLISFLCLCCFKVSIKVLRQKWDTFRLRLTRSRHRIHTHWASLG